MKKGFTLIEMLGIIVVLGIILLVTFPNMNESLKQMKTATENNFTNNLKISAEAYIELNRDKYPELDTPGNSVNITIQELYDANLLKGEYTDINTNYTITVTTQADHTLNYYYNGEQIGIE